MKRYVDAGYTAFGEVHGTTVSASRINSYFSFRHGEIHPSDLSSQLIPIIDSLHQGAYPSESSLCSPDIYDTADHYGSAEQIFVLNISYSLGTEH